MEAFKGWIKDAIIPPQRAMGGLLIGLSALLMWRVWNAQTLSTQIRHAAMTPEQRSTLLIGINAGLFLLWGLSHWLPDPVQSKAGMARIGFLISVTIVSGLLLV